ncbi:acyltransferase [Actinoplanes sp. KI2]|uniref:acyltransferase family protein n=1 Tax=Actinoplanes sp. KI2 TaxID=2983315 RepID=UPI0021D579EC|nr:acyltransferase [Actinoplanes sp. KI2]MCU7728064.1 acyltransferase [Actinoplanes sp. KI2]
MRNRYLDLLRAAAIVRVIVYHLFGWPWLSIVLPAMGIMFALAGSLTAASLERRAGRRVVYSRLRRLLPPLWLLGLIVVPVMLIMGWRQEVGGEHPFSLPRLLFWIFPVGDPPGSDAAVDAWEPLWYVRAYLWFILLSPFLYALYKRIGWAAVALPLALIVVLDRTGLTLPATADAAMWDFVTFGACWMAGFAHRDGRLRRLPVWVAYPVAIALGAAAMYYLSGHQGDDPWDLNDVPESQALWSIAFVLIVLRWQPPMAWLARVRPLDRLVTLLNARAVTVYLWHNIAIDAVWPILAFVALDDLAGRLGAGVDLVMALVVTLIAVLLFGWAEDLAARRAPKLWPTGSRAFEKEEIPEPADVPEPPAIASGRPDVRAYGAAAAMSPRPGAWVPRTGFSAPPVVPGTGSGTVPSDGRHTATGDGDDRNVTLGLPVAGRRASRSEQPLVGEVLDAPGDRPDWFRPGLGRPGQ